MIEHPQVASRWHADSNNIVVLRLPTEAALRHFETKLADHGLRTVLFTEPDLDDTATALAVEPSPLASDLCSYLALAGKEYPPMLV